RRERWSAAEAATRGPIEPRRRLGRLARERVEPGPEHVVEVALASRAEPDLIVKMLELSVRGRRPAGLAGALLPGRWRLDGGADERADAAHRDEQYRSGDETDRCGAVGVVDQELDRRDA